MVSTSLFLSKLKNISVYRRGDQRAPHKPLYLLYCISSLQQGQPRLQSYERVAEKLGDALRLFAPRVDAVHPEYPFWRLQQDGLAVVEVDGPLEFRLSNTDPKVSSLRKRNARGGLTDEDYWLLKEDLDAQSSAVHMLLDAHFPASIHEDIIRFFNLKIGDPHFNDKSTECEFRNQVLMAYDFKCAITEFSLSYEGTYPGIEAAHICSPQSGGNDAVGNGVAMSTLYRKLFHLGLFTIDCDYSIVVSSKVKSWGETGDGLISLHGRPISLPMELDKAPNLESLEWHRRWVFRG